MSVPPRFLMVAPTHYNVSYSINPWMDPGRWRQDPQGMHAQAQAQTASAALCQALQGAGAEVELAPGSAGLPDMVFPANSAVVLDGKALLSRFRHPERRAEEERFLAIFKALQAKGLLREVAQLPPGCFQEGAGDCVWDATRQQFWGGFGPRSSRQALAAIASHFGHEVVPLELTSSRCYHLDVCFCVLSGGEIFYLPEALTPEALRTLRARVDERLLIEASEDDLVHFSLNAICVGRHIVMSRCTPALRERLQGRGYTVVEVDLSPFMLSGGSAYCMSLRLDWQSQAFAAGVQSPGAVAKHY